jgi:hypothetical protein
MKAVMKRDNISTKDDRSSSPPEVTRDAVRRSLKQTLQSLNQDVVPWHQQRAATPRGSDFDLRRESDRGADVLGSLKATGAILGEALAKRYAASAVQDGLTYLEEPLGAMSKSREPERHDALQQAFLQQYGTSLQDLSEEMAEIARGLRGLSNLTARGAAELDPNGTNRIYDRMRTLGDATLRQIEDALCAAVSRDDRKRLQLVRDEMTDWMVGRDERLQEMLPAIEELNVRDGVLRSEALIQSNRLAKAAEMAGRAAGTSDSGGHLNHAEQAAPEAETFSARLRALLLGAHIDITAPLQGT